MGNFCCSDELPPYQPTILPQIPMLDRPSALMDGRSVMMMDSDHGPFLKDGQYLDVAPTVNMQVMDFPAFIHDPRTERGEQKPAFKFYSTKHTYTGEWKNHKFHGNGLLILQNGDYLIGSFRNGSPAGLCRLVLFSQGCVFEGYMQDWCAQGDGQFRTITGEYTYIGSFHRSNADGEGIEQTPNSKFQGIFSKANKVKGILQLQGGYVYDGDFHNNLFHGMGKLMSPNGQYIGEFRNGKKWGFGKFKWKDGSTYEGEYANDMKNGKGRYAGPDGIVIQEGEWRGGKFISGPRSGIMTPGSNRMSGTLPISPIGSTMPMGGGTPMPMGGVGAPMPGGTVVMGGVPPSSRGPAPAIPGGSPFDAAVVGIANNQGASSYFPPLSSNYTPPAASIYSPAPIQQPPIGNMGSKYNPPGINGSNYTPAAGLVPGAAMSRYTPAGAGSQYIPPAIGVTSPSQYAPMNGMSFSNRVP